MVVPYRVPLLCLLLFGTQTAYINCQQQQCPISVQLPCICQSTRYEPVSLLCENAQSLGQVLQAIGNPSMVIDSLVISNTPIHELPAYAFSGLAIKRLVLKRNGLINLHPDAFDSPIIQTLMELEIRDQKLGEVPQSGLPRLRALRVLALTKNGIRSIPPQAFANYESKNLLRRLDLSANRLQSIPAAAFLGLDKLEELSLDKNFLEALPTQALQPLTELQDLSLAVNRIKQVSSGSIPLTKLKSLSLEVNEIDRIPRDALQSLANLHYLYLGSNRLSSLDPELFYYIPKLKVLAASQNPKITRLTANAFMYVPDLVRLELSECGLTELMSSTFMKIRQVQVLLLNGNKVKRLTTNTFTSLQRLVSLDLSANEISSVADRTFSRMPNLRHLDLSQNRLESLPRNVFMNSFQTTNPATSRVLYLYENPWDCAPSLLWLRLWLGGNGWLSVDAPGHAPTVCASPASAMNGTFRLSQSEQAWTTNQPAPESSTQMSTQPAEFNQATPVVTTAKRDLIAVVFGLLLGLICIILLLLLLVRYFVTGGQRARERREQAQLASYTNSSLHSTNAGTAPYSSTYTPWYWWF